MFISNDIIYDLKEDIIKLVSEEMSTYLDYNVETRAKLIKDNKQLKEKYPNKENKNLEKIYHQTVKKVTEDFESLKELPN